MPQSVGRKLASLRERTVRIHMDAHHSPLFPHDLAVRFPGLFLKIEYLKNPFFATFLIEKWPIWARSSTGRAEGFPTPKN